MICAHCECKIVKLGRGPKAQHQCTGCGVINGATLREDDLTDEELDELEDDVLDMVVRGFGE